MYKIKYSKYNISMIKKKEKWLEIGKSCGIVNSDTNNDINIIGDFN